MESSNISEDEPSSSTASAIENIAPNQRPDAAVEGPSVPLMEKLVQTLIAALETHIKSKSVASSSRSSSKSRRDSSGHDSLFGDGPARGGPKNHGTSPITAEPPSRRGTFPISEPEPFKSKIGRPPPYPDGQIRWVSQDVWESYRPPQEPVLPAPRPDPMAVLYQVYMNTKWLCIQSPILIEAYDKVNKHPRLSSRWGNIIELEPFPSLFYHLDDIRAEVEATHGEKGKLDFQALEFVSREFEPRWQDAREEKFEEGHCTYRNIWRLFNPGDLVVRTDELGAEWLFVLIEMRHPEEVGWTETDFVTWGLSWNSLDSVIYRKVYTFSLLNFEGRRKITELPVYPLERKGDQKESFLKRLAERGQKWQELMVAAQTMRMHDGLAMPERSRRRRNSEDSDDGRRPDLTGIRKVIYHSVECFRLPLTFCS
jgi:hypothetical protein